MLAAALGCTATIATAMPTPFTEESTTRGLTYVVSAVSPFGSDFIGIGVMFADLDNDGDPDIVAIGKAGGALGIYENDGSGFFTDRFVTSGAPSLPAASSVIAADYDGDGDLDIFIGNIGQQDVLLRNDGAFTFTDVAAAAGIAGTALSATIGCSWADYDNDGWVDLYVGNYTGRFLPTHAQNATEQNHLYRNQGDGTFVDVAATLGVDDANSPTLQVIFFDHDLDGDADLYLSTDKGYTAGTENHLFENDGMGGFTDITATAGVAANYDSMGVGIGDFDGNGLNDLYPTNIHLGTDLYLNMGGGSFVESADFCGVRSFRIGWAAHFFDYDNNETQDLYVCNSNQENRLYVNGGSFPVSDLGPALGVNVSGASYGLAVADVDNDGDQDILVPNLGEQLILYINHEGENNNWIKFDVVGEGANTNGIGTVVTINNGGNDLIREVFAGGNSYKSQNELLLQFGLGANTTAGSIDALWPGGTTRSLSGYPAGQTWTLYPPSRLGDDNNDGSVLLDDFVAFAAAYHQGFYAPGNEAMDLDGDADVDDDDFTEFLAVYTGPQDDCNDNMILDLQEILDDAMLDLDQDGVLDSCQGPTGPTGDINGDCMVDTADLGILIAAFGSSDPDADINGDGAVDTADLGVLIGQFGDSCP